MAEDVATSISEEILTHARWIYSVKKILANDGSYSLSTITYCSACNHEIPEGTERPFCPKCKARMDAAWNSQVPILQT